MVVGGGGGVESDYSVCPCQDGLSGNPVYIIWDLPLKGGGPTQFHQVTKNAFSEIRCSLPFELWAWLEQKSGLEFSGGGTAGYMVENSENSVCPRPLLQFLQFRSVRLRQVPSVYVGGTGRGARQYGSLS